MHKYLDIYGKWTSDAYINESKREAYNHFLDFGDLILVDVQVQAKNLQALLLQVRWAAFRHNLSIGMQAMNGQPFGDGRELIYRKGEGVRDPQKREEGPHLKGKAHDDKIKRSKWESLTISTTTNIHLVVLEGSSV